VKVCILGRYNSSEILTGPEKVAKRLFEELACNSNTVFLEYFFDGRRHGLFKKLFGFEVVDHTGNGTILRCGILRLNWVLFKIRPAILHVAGFERFVVIALFYRFFSHAKLVFTVNGVTRHETLHFRKNFPLFLQFKDSICEWLLMTFADRLIFLSEQSRTIASTYYKFDPKRSVLLPNGVDEVFHETKRQYHTSQPRTANIVFIGEIGRPEKGFDFLHRTLAQIEQSVSLFLVGSEHAPAEEAESNLKIHNVGMKSTTELAELLGGMDIYVSPSSCEAFSLSAVEAMASGVVPVVTAETGMSRFIRNGENGFIVPYGDVGTLTRVLLLLINDRALMKRMSGNSKEIYDLLSWKNVADQVEEVYRALIL
jgi:glycosyltransferase involved in cell wall biosynthesis